jgi:hypothetical protein
MDGFTFSHHALQRALDMQVDGDTLRKVLTRPHYIIKCRDNARYDYFSRGDVTCMVDSLSGLVITVLWRTEKAWRKDLKNKPAYAGRSYRGETA